MHDIGIIPACAGSTARRVSSWGAPRDHPRMRGEHSSATYSSRDLPGSSPHARGAREREARRVGLAGIIPACAGSTSRPSSQSRWRRDHPRMRGEHAAPCCLGGSSTGSSPHARGAQAYAAATEILKGIIPACAGSTDFDSVPSARHWDHPRMRGEHTSRPARLVAILA